MPNSTTILTDYLGATASDEGRAMAQLIHDTAPGSAIAFHTAFESELDFAEGIIRLQENAGSDVIVDDVRYFAEPFPARTTVAVAGLPLGARVEIDMVARRP